MEEVMVEMAGSVGGGGGPGAHSYCIDGESFQRIR